MKHAIAGRKLNRSKKHRAALFTNLMVNLFEHGVIKTTQAKAKALQNLVDKTLTKAKQGGLNARRDLAKVFGKRAVVNTLVDRLAKASTRVSGYTRIVTLGERLGDNALMVRLELIDYQAPTASQTKAKPDKKVSAQSVPAKTAVKRKPAAVKVAKKA